MSAKIITLRCPSCGSADSVDGQVLGFGLEFTCKHCASKSVLIQNNELYVPRPGERVCVPCGRVSSAEAKFCQCGASLVRRCVSCGREIAIDHVVCDYCGWSLQDVSPISLEGRAVRAKRALAEFESSDEGVSRKALADLFDCAPPEQLAETLEKMARAKHRWSEAMLYMFQQCGRDSLPALSHLRTIENYRLTARAVICLVIRNEPLAEDASLLEEILRDDAPSSLRQVVIEALGHCGPPAIRTLVPLLENDEDSDAAWNALLRIGTPALAPLRAARGFFASAKMKTRAKYLIGMIERH